MGQVNFFDLYPMTFFEFLDAAGENRYRKLLEETDNLEPFPLVFHEDLVDILRIYYFVGGMPEAVKYYAKSGNLTEVRSIQEEILDSYVLDFAKHASPSDIPKISLVCRVVYPGYYPPGIRTG